MAKAHPQEHQAAALSLHLDQDALRPMIAAVVAETLAQLRSEQEKVPTDRLAYSEKEAAEMLGLAVHQLRDERHRGRIEASQVVGRRVRYLRDDLLAYLAAGRAAK